MPIRRVCLKHKWPTLFRRAFSASRSELSDRIYTYFTHVTHPQHARHDKKQYFLFGKFLWKWEILAIDHWSETFLAENCCNAIVPECWPIERHFSIAASFKVLPPNPTAPSLLRDIKDKRGAATKSAKMELALFERPYVPDIFHNNLCTYI